MSKTVKKTPATPARKPAPQPPQGEIIISLEELQAEREAARQEAEKLWGKNLTVQLPQDLWQEWTAMTDSLGLPPGPVLKAVLRAFLDMYAEENGLQFPIMLQPVPVPS